jgi:murein DD-endopeptidase MepM/ murein hydrolase activator NlpD
LEYGRIISRFGCRARPGLAAGTRIGPCPDRQQFHLAIDIAGDMGAPIYAANDGIVGATWPDGALAGYGNLTILWHNDGFGTLYAHQKDILVRAGQQVMQGQLIGHVGITEAGQRGPRAASGALMTPHCHFEVLLGHTRRAAGFQTRPTSERPRREMPARMEPSKYLAIVNFAPFAHPYSERPRGRAT